jgi:hypothetical protein
MKRIQAAILFLIILAGTAARSQTVTTYKAWDIQTVVAGNNETKDYGILNNFYVARPITINALGAFDSMAGGFKGSGIIKVQLYQQQNSDKGDQLLETVTFDAGSPGSLDGCFRYKNLAVPLTLLPGVYTITVSGFDKQNKEYNFTLPPSESSYQPTMSLNDGGGLIQFLGCNRFHSGDPGKNSAQEKNIGPANRFAAVSFQFSAAAPYASPFAADYAALMNGITTFPVDAGKSNLYGRVVTLNRYGSLALLQDNAFPLVMEPSGERLILEAASYQNGNPNGSRCVAFTHEQWGHATNDARMAMFENAILWASRKANPADIVLGLTTNLNAGYFTSRGYQVRNINPNMKDTETNLMVGCDALVMDFNARYTKRYFTRLTEYAANGGSVVITYLPWRDVHGGLHPEFTRINTFLQPYGMAYRTSLTPPSDFMFTNVQPNPYPPILFNGFPAAELLRESRLGQVQLSSLEKVIAMHTVSYAADRQPATLAALTAIYSGSSTNNPNTAATVPDNFADILSLTGSQADTNYIGQWQVDGNDLLSLDSRGGSTFNFMVGAADIYRLKIACSQNNPLQATANFSLVLSLDDIPLGQYNLTVTPNTNSVVTCLTPFIATGSHNLRVFWDNVSVQNQLRLQSVRVQSALGTDGNNTGIKDWVEALVNSQSGLDGTNTTVTSLTSPYCLEGHDQYPGLMTINVSGSDDNIPQVVPFNSPNGRWFANVPLGSDGNTLATVSYQNGVKTQLRTLQWLPVNVLQGGNLTIRSGDSLNLIARPDAGNNRDKGTVQFTIGTNQYAPRKATAQMPHAFSDPGIVTVGGIYTATNGVAQTGTLTVNVVDHAFPDNPAGWVGMDRGWDTVLPPEAKLQADSRLFLSAIAPLPGGGWRNSLMVDAPITRYIVSRLGTNGPVLGSSMARGFNFWHGADTYTKVVETYADHSELVEMMLVLHPVLPDIRIEMNVIVGGVVFLDGTISKTLVDKDFDAQGRCFVRFIRPASAKTSVCHSIRVWQGDTLIGVVL